MKKLKPILLVLMAGVMAIATSPSLPNNRRLQSHPLKK